MTFSVFKSFPLRFLAAVVLAASFTLSMGEALAQFRPAPLEEFISSSDKKQLDKTHEDLYKKFDKVTAPYGASVAYICRGNRAVALGTVIAPGKVLTKLSDLQGKRGLLSIAYNNEIYDTQLVGGDINHDLVLLDCPSLQAPALDFDKQGKMEEGDFLLTVLPTGEAGDFGVISVPARSISEADIPYIGFEADFSYTGDGALIAKVFRGSGAHAAGIRRGDLVIKLNGHDLAYPVNVSMQSALKDKKPGEEVEAVVIRGKQQYKAPVTLTTRPRSQQFPTAQLEKMNRMGNQMSRRRGDFPYVIQSDMTLNPAHAGAPVIDVNGKVVGLALSRAGRTETFILPASVIANSLKAGLLAPEKVNESTDDIAGDASTPEREKKNREYSDYVRAMQRGIHEVEVVE